MAGIEGVGSIGGSDGGIEEFQKAQTARVTEFQAQATEAKKGGGSSTAQDAASSVGNAQGGASSQYPPL